MDFFPKENSIHHNFQPEHLSFPILLFEHSPKESNG